MRFCESGMTFGDFSESDCFRIEKSEVYIRLSGKGIKTTDFLLHKPEDNKLLFVEAKETLPAKKNREAFNAEIAHISHQFMDSLQLSCGIWFGEHNKTADVPKNSVNFFRYGVQIVFVLVVKERTGSLLYIADKIKQQLPKEHKLWRFDVIVLNKESAQKAKLVVKK